MLNRACKLVAAAAIAMGFGTASAYADACSGHNHVAGTALGAVGGAAIGGAVSHGNIGGVLAGGVLGGLAGNAVSRDIDCRHHRYGYYRHRHRSRYYWHRGHRYARW